MVLVMDYYAFANIEPCGNVAYRVEVFDENQIFPVTPEYPFFVTKPTNYTLNKTSTVFSNYRYQGTGIDFDATITFDLFPGGDLLYATFHILDLGPHPEKENQYVHSVRETDFYEFNNGESRSFPLSDMNPIHFYQVFFNVYTDRQQTSVIYMSVEDYPEYDPIVITRMTIDVPDEAWDSTKIFLRISNIYNKETDPNHMYQLTIHATPLY
jgi:hypothetical protein